MIIITVTILVSVLVYKSFCNTVCIYGHANKASCCCCCCCCASCSACYVGETNRHFATRIREHLSSDKHSHIFKHLRGSENCRSLCSEDCFEILDSASISFQLKIREAMYILWQQPSLNSQVKLLNLSLSY